MSKLPPTQPENTDDLHNPKVNAAALDFLLIELVPLAQRIAEQVLAREQVLIDEYKKSKIFNSNPQSASQKAQSADSTTATPAGTVDGSVKGATANGSTVASLGFPAVSEETREAMLWRLESLGYRVGQGLVER